MCAIVQECQSCPCIAGDADESEAEGRTPGSPGRGLGCTPRRQAMRQIAHQKMLRAAGQMQARAQRKDGFGEVLPVGTVVSIPISDVDRAKVDSHTIVGVIVDAQRFGSKRNEMKYRVATAAGLLKTWRTRPYMAPQPNVTPTLVSLEHVLACWKEMPEVSERACAKFLSAVGGQGLIHCLCKGLCESQKCSCKKAGRLCTSRCHHTNICCTNK